MSKEFIQEKVGSASISLAKQQQDQISYFVNSKVQEDVTMEYLNAWASRKFRTDDHFLNFVKNIFREENFLTFFKYLRNPNPASNLIHNRIKEPLRRVYHSEDFYDNYVKRGKQIDKPDFLNDGFAEMLFNKLLFEFNSIVVHDLSDINKPYRNIISIDKVVSIESKNDKIKRIAYTAKTKDENGNEVLGYAYLDNKRFAFYDKDYNLIKEANHDLGYCPAFYLSNEAFESSDDIVRESHFSRVREELEEYVFLKTLRRMSDAGGVIPIYTQLKTKVVSNDGKTTEQGGKMPMTSNEIKGQRPEIQSEFTGSDSILQPGTKVDVPPIRKTDGSIDMDVVKNLINFFHTPVEPLKYLTERIDKIEQSIIISLLGDYSEANEDAKNELQVSKSFVSKEDILRNLSTQLSKVHSDSDTAMMQLAFGTDNTEAEVFYGSDFFLESQAELFELFKNSPNALERKNILVRMAQSRNKFNPQKAKKETILYKLLPFASDGDFNLAVSNKMVDETTFKLQNQFYYWINLFEATYGSLVSFWDAVDIPEAKKIEEINSLLNTIIIQNSNTNVNN